MSLRNTEPNFMEHLKSLLLAGGNASELEAAAQALAGLSPEDRDLLAAVQESPYRLTTLEQFWEFPANTEYFVLEPNIRKVEDVGWRSIWMSFCPRSCWMPVIPFPSATTPCGRNRTVLRAEAISLSGDEWEHERPRERQTEKALHPGAAGGRKAECGTERPGQVHPAAEPPS